MKSQPGPRRPTRAKTKADFLRRLKKRRALKKLEAEEKMDEEAQEMKQALMVWVDDGGPPA